MSSTKLSSARKVNSKQLRAERMGLKAAKETTSKPKDRTRFGFGGRLLFAFPIILALKLMAALGSGDIVRAITAFAGIVLMFLGAIVVQKGLSNEARNEDSVRSMVAQPPFKLGGSVLYGLGVALFCLFNIANGPVFALLYGALAILACVMMYGLDPKPEISEKSQFAETHGLDLKAVIRDLNEAEDRIDRIRDHAAMLPGASTQASVGKIADLADKVVATIEEDPKDIRKAHRFLISYLPRAEEIVVRFAKDPKLFADSAMTERFQTVVSDLNSVFEEQTKQLTSDDSLDLEVKLDVLSQRLKREGAG